jgi:imidazolonepropionase-like amidohydrolase
VRDAVNPGANAHLQVVEAQYCKAGAHYLTGSGTDSFGTMPGISLHTELELLVKACLTRRQALAAATGNVGTVFGWRDVGQIRAGYKADLLVLDANPIADLANLKKISHLMLAGDLVDRDALIRSVR